MGYCRGCARGDHRGNGRGDGGSDGGSDGGGGHGSGGDGSGGAGDSGGRGSSDGHGCIRCHYRGMSGLGIIDGMRMTRYRMTTPSGTGGTVGVSRGNPSSPSPGTSNSCKPHTSHYRTSLFLSCISRRIRANIMLSNDFRARICKIVRDQV